MYNTKGVSNQRQFTAYESAKFTVSGTAVNYNVKKNTSLFSELTVANEFRIYVSGNDADFKLNSETNDSIYIYSGTEKTITNFPTQNVFITASGELTAEILILGWR